MQNKPTDRNKPPDPGEDVLARRAGQRTAGSVTMVRAIIGLVIFGIAVSVGYMVLTRRAPPPAFPVAEAPVVVDPPKAAAAILAPRATMVEIKPIAVEPAKPTARPLATVPPVAPTATAPAAPARKIDVITLKPGAGPKVGESVPLYGPAYDPDDGKPVINCQADRGPSHLMLTQIQAAGLDVKNGFHLGLIPVDLNEKYALNERTSMIAIVDGTHDCILEQIDELDATYADFGVLTSVIDESAGADGIWARDMKSYLDLKGKKIAFVGDSSAEYFMNYTLALLPEDIRRTVTPIAYDSPAEAIAAFNDNKADAVSASQPYLGDAAKSGGAPLLNTDQLRIVLHGVFFSKKAIATKPDAVQAFHKAYYEAITIQIDDPDTAAAQIVAWGNPEWTGINAASAGADFRRLMKTVAMANISDNIALMKDGTALARQVALVRKVRATLKATVSTVEPASQIDARFVNALATLAPPKGDAINPSFSLSGLHRGKEGGGDVTKGVLSVLPCRNFAFEPNSSELTADAKRLIEICVLPAILARDTAQLKIVGSAAWPGPPGTFVENEIQGFADARAQAIATYLESVGVNAKRMLVQGVLPPEDHRNTLDQEKQASDRFVEMTLVTGGW